MLLNMLYWDLWALDTELNYIWIILYVFNHHTEIKAVEIYGAVLTQVDQTTKSIWTHWYDVWYETQGYYWLLVLWWQRPSSSRGNTGTYWLLLLFDKLTVDSEFHCLYVLHGLTAFFSSFLICQSCTVTVGLLWLGLVFYWSSPYICCNDLQTDRSCYQHCHSVWPMQLLWWRSYTATQLHSLFSFLFAHNKYFLMWCWHCETTLY